jgi:glycerophosphoryl diester phosphodiesterase
MAKWGMCSSSTRPLDIQGHRGARGRLPENTLPAFARALSIGVTTLELDCAITRDGVVMVSHDATLNPDITRDTLGDEAGRWITRADLAISQFTFAELQRFDVGRINPLSEYATQFSHQQAYDGVRMPRLDEVFALAQKAGNSTVRFNIETKISPFHPERTVQPEPFVQALLRVIEANALTRRVTIQSFDWRTLRVVQQQAPEIATAYLTAQQAFMDNVCTQQTSSPWNAGMHVSQFGGSVPRMIKAMHGAVWSPCSADIDITCVREAQSLGLAVVVWTVNTESDMHLMMDWEVDGIISDYPDVLRRVAGARNYILPPATPISP